MRNGDGVLHDGGGTTFRVVGITRRAWPPAASDAQALAGHPTTSGRVLAASAGRILCLARQTHLRKGASRLQLRGDGRGARAGVRIERAQTRFVLAYYQGDTFTFICERPT